MRIEVFDEEVEAASVLPPTHRCFDDALDYLQAAVMDAAGVPEVLEYIRHVITGSRPPRAASRVKRFLARYAVVHGVCLHPGDSTDRFAHAWVEHQGYVIQATLLERRRVFYRMASAEFRKAWRPRDMTRYTVEETLRKNYTSGHYGPWESRYAELVHPRGSLVKEA